MAAQRRCSNAVLLIRTPNESASRTPSVTDQRTSGVPQAELCDLKNRVGRIRAISRPLVQRSRCILAALESVDDDDLRDHKLQARKVVKTDEALARIQARCTRTSPTALSSHLLLDVLSSRTDEFVRFLQCESRRKRIRLIVARD